MGNLQNTEDVPLCCYVDTCPRVYKLFCGGPGSGEATQLGCYRSAAHSTKGNNIDGDRGQL